MISDIWIRDARSAFLGAVDRFDPARPALVLTHNDADGLSAGALLMRALRGAGRAADIRVLGRGEGAWSEETAAELRARAPGGLLVSDLGVEEGAPLPGLPTAVIDHHVPRGTPGDAALVSGYGQDPTPTSSLLAYWCAQGLSGSTDTPDSADAPLWLAAVGIAGDLGDKAPFAELAEARKRYGATALREAVSLVNAPRRTAAGDAGPALALLLRADSPKDLLSGRHPELEALQAAREEVRQALEEARRLPPRIRGDVALIRMHSACQVHPLVAQSWRGRLRDKIVLAANTGYRPGWVHFAARSGRDQDLIAFLRHHRPPGADAGYGGGHQQATGGAVRPAAWNHFAAGLGFGPEMQVPETDA